MGKVYTTFIDGLTEYVIYGDNSTHGHGEVLRSGDIPPPTEEGLEPTSKFYALERLASAGSKNDRHGELWVRESSHQAEHSNC